MNITKQQWTIIGVVVAIILVWYFFLRKKKAESSYRVDRVNKIKRNVGAGLGRVSAGVSSGVCGCYQKQADGTLKWIESEACCGQAATA